MAHDTLLEKLKNKSIENEELLDCLNSKKDNVVGPAILTIMDRGYCDERLIKKLAEIASTLDGYKVVGPYQMSHLALAALFLVKAQPALDCYLQIYDSMGSNDKFLVDNFIAQYEKGSSNV